LTSLEFITRTFKVSSLVFCFTQNPFSTNTNLLSS